MSFLWHDKPAKDISPLWVWLVLGGSVLVAQGIAMIAKAGGW